MTYRDGDLMHKQFYVYIHKKPDGTPVYVGKGHGKRAYNLHNRNPHHQAVLNKYKGQIIIEVTNCETEQAAFELEKIYIKQLRDQGYRLCNQTDGGEGVSGFKFPDEIKERVNAINRTKIRSEEFKSMVSAQWKGVKRGEQSPTHKQRNAEAKKGNTFRRGAKHTPESIEKMKIAQRAWREQKKKKQLIEKLKELENALQEK